MKSAIIVAALALACAGTARAGSPDLAQPQPDAAQAQPDAAQTQPHSAQTQPEAPQQGVDSLIVHGSDHAMGHHVPVPRRLRSVKTRHVDQFKLADRQGFKRVSDLVPFPAFYPGLGIVTVKPETLPMGPFRCFDRAGNLVSTVYMPLLSDMNSHKTWDKVKGLPAPVDHVTMYFHPGHAGVNVPHYHVVLWHVRAENVVAK